MAEHRYSVRLSSSSRRAWRRLPPDVRRRAEPVLDGLSENPRPFGVIKLQGSAQLYRVRTGQYRVIYQINDAERLITITHIQHRRDAYRSL
ncbi:MAG: type II toxin-antitoxin system RelE/ParE family toxin [Chloroflexi bacterium]|nr:type II toxin-antitoxin system RelE/ParE family toxin [Chloroflexota bacterium]